MDVTWLESILEGALNIWAQKYSEILSLLTQSPQSFNGGVYGVIVSINGAMQAIGNSLLVIFFMTSVIQNSTLQDFRRPEQILKMFLRLIIAKIIIVYGFDLMNWMLQLGMEIIGRAGNLGALGGGSSFELPVEIVAAINEMNLLGKAAGVLIAIPAWLIIVALSFMTAITVYGRFFKIYMYIALSPLPLSTFGGERSSQIGKQFLKAYAGVILEGLLIVIACMIFSAFAGNASSLGGSEPLSMLLGYTAQTVFQMLILYGTIKACDRIVKEMLGI